VQITEERKKRVIDLYFNQHKTYAEIAQIEHISPRDIHAIIKEEETRLRKYEHQQHQEQTKDIIIDRLDPVDLEHKYSSLLHDFSLQLCAIGYVLQKQILY
jgi:predicted DNA-binding protein YlxM (UPF0122 family)